LSFLEWRELVPRLASNFIPVGIRLKSNLNS
jgi:hypothetical protein